MKKAPIKAPKKKANGNGEVETPEELQALRERMGDGGNGKALGPQSLIHQTYTPEQLNAINDEKRMHAVQRGRSGYVVSG